MFSKLEGEGSLLYREKTYFMSTPFFSPSFWAVSLRNLGDGDAKCRCKSVFGFRMILAFQAVKRRHADAC